jgi:hypothetical protein
MPVKIVLDHPRRYTFRRLWRRILMVMGAVLLVVGIAASIVAVPANVLAAAWFLDEDIDIEFESGRTLSADEVLLAWAVSTPLAFFGVRRRLRLTRRIDRGSNGLRAHFAALSYRAPREVAARTKRRSTRLGRKISPSPATTIRKFAESAHSEGPSRRGGLTSRGSRVAGRRRTAAHAQAVPASPSRPLHRRRAELCQHRLRPSR